MMDWSLLENALILAGSVIFTIGTLTWWLSTQFNSTRDLIYTKIQEVINKLEYHEKHDDVRFQEVRNDIWEIRLRNAAIDGKIIRRTKQDGSEQGPG